VLAWPLSNPRDPACCVAALEVARGQGCPAIFTTDQGVPCTSLALTSRLARAGVASRLAGRGRALDHSFVERRWRTVTYEASYRTDDSTVPALGAGRERDVHCYNHERPHHGFAYRTPAAVHWAPSGCHGNIHLIEDLWWS
jgi:putative transposase